MTALRAALAAYCSDNRVKLVHVWQVKPGVCNAMVEWPYEPNRKVATERHATGVGSDPVQATIAALDRIGFGGIIIRVYVLTQMLGLR